VESPFELTEALAEHALPVPALQEVEKQALTNRPDLKRIACEEAAQRESVSIAKSSFGPRVNAFAGWEMDNPTFLAGGGGNNWLGGDRTAIRHLCEERQPRGWASGEAIH